MIDVRQSRELQAIVLAFRDAESRIRNGMRRAARREANATWRPALQARPATLHQQRVLVAGAAATVRADGSLELRAATRGRALRGGLVPRDRWFGAEFGAHRFRQFGRRVKVGKVVYPAAREVGPKVVAAYVNGAVGGLLEGTTVETT